MMGRHILYLVQPGFKFEEELMLKRILGCAAILLCVASLASANVIFSDDFDDGAGQTRWSGPIVALENPLLGWDGTVDYAYDYSGVAGSAPNSGGSTIGVAFTSNNTNSVGDEGEAVGIIPMASLADIPPATTAFPSMRSFTGMENREAPNTFPLVPTLPKLASHCDLVWIRAVAFRGKWMVTAIPRPTCFVTRIHHH